MPTRTEEIMREIYTDSEAELKQFNGEQDHIRRYLGQYIENQQSPI